VVRRNDQLRSALSTVSDLYERAKRCSLSDTGNWTNQNVVFTKALLDMFPLALTILKGALQRDESRGAHYKPDFSMGALTATEPVERRRQAEAWCDKFDENNRKWLKSTIASWDGNEVQLSYEDVDTSLITPRPRLYGLVGADEIEKVWKERQAAKEATASGNGNGASGSPKPALAGAK
jgi:succinate dehydrogenase / fumarate reductase, flavoprotein subunit